MPMKISVRFTDEHDLLSQLANWLILEARNTRTGGLITGKARDKERAAHVARRIDELAETMRTITLERINDARP